MRKIYDNLGNEIKRNDIVWLDRGCMAYQCKVIKINKKGKLKLKSTMNFRIPWIFKIKKSDEDKVYLNCEKYHKQFDEEKEEILEVAKNEFLKTLP